MASAPENLYRIAQESSDYLRSRGINKIDIAVVLGSGMSSIIEGFNNKLEIKFDEVPHFVTPGVKEHRGRIVLCVHNGKSILFFVGRVHFYEGYDMWQVSLPVRVAHNLGATQLIVTGAAGGLNTNYTEGDIVLLTDHINLQSENPLRGVNDARLGLRFPDMSNPYEQTIRTELESAAENSNISTYRGVYASLPGPSLETKAEYKYLHIIGADLVGMSIVPEVIVGVQCGLQIAGICVVSNICYPPEKVTHTTIESVLEVVHRSAQDVARLLDAVWTVNSQQ